MVAKGIEGIGIKEDALREMLKQVIHQPHVIPGICSFKPHCPVDKYIVIGQDNSDIQGDAAEDEQDYSCGNRRPRYA